MINPFESEARRRKVAKLVAAMDEQFHYCKITNPQDQLDAFDHMPPGFWVKLSRGARVNPPSPETIKDVRLVFANRCVDRWVPVVVGEPIGKVGAF